MVAILSTFTILCLSSYFVVYFFKSKLILFFNRVVYYFTWIFLILLPHQDNQTICHHLSLVSFLLSPFFTSKKKIRRIFLFETNIRKLFYATKTPVKNGGIINIWFGIPSRINIFLPSDQNVAMWLPMIMVNSVCYGKSVTDKNPYTKTSGVLLWWI